MNTIFFRNSQGNQTTIIIILSGIAIALIILISISLFNKENTTTPPINNDIPTEIVDDSVDKVESTKPVPITEDEFRTEVPINIVVPGVDTELSVEQQKEIALPLVVVPAAPGSTSKFRNFKINAENDIFIPNKVIANVGDTVHIDFTAVDKAYDIAFPSYNMKQSAVQGQTRILEFKAKKEGNFTYYCPSCGGPEVGPSGNIIIVATK
jgi:heme/copper-type cytochrome/quinol oxidase subunit 2